MPSNSRSTSNPISDTFTGLVAMYVRLRVTGKQHLPKEGAWILVANHTSHVDTAVLFAAVLRRLRRRLHAAAAQDYFFDRGLRQYAARTLFNAIPVDRQRSSGRDPLRHVLRALREGDGVLIFPEGTRSMDGRLGPFRGGIGRLIAEFPGVPVIPAYIEGAVDVLPKGHALPAPNVVRVTFGAPLRLPADPHDRATWQAAADQVRAAIVQLAEPEKPPDAPAQAGWARVRERFRFRRRPAEPDAAPEPSESPEALDIATEAPEVSEAPEAPAAAPAQSRWARVRERFRIRQ